MLKTTVWGTPNKLKLTFTIKSKQRSTRACLPPPACWLRKAFSRAIFVNKISSFQIKWHRTLSQVFNKSWIRGDPVMRADIECWFVFCSFPQKQSTTTRSCSTWKRLEKERKTKDLQSAARGLMSRSSRSPLAGSHFACCVDTDGLSNKAGSTYPEGLVGD